MSGDYISREALKQALTDKFKSRIEASRIPTWNDAFNAVTNLTPAADVVEVRHGRWIVKGDAQPISNDKVYGCSLCDGKNRRYYEWQLSNYCPNCGAKMDLPEPQKEEAPAGPYDLLYEEGGANTT